ncbi:NADH-quinone oxidoreductase subunit H [uncultured Methanobrevibacter sp.]|uniref:respiratory chain complex I subunit 1 family protein n=1 Tax=uncultured Methanobrevibacter sp. TaxID=253161 RepID=UPI002612C495
MSYETIVIPVLKIIITLIIALFIGVLIPGIERKYVHARIQRRVGPPVTSSGLWASIKFLYKENIEPNSPAPGLYKAMPILCFIVVLAIFLVLMPDNYQFMALASLIAIVGFLKVEEIAYVIMGSLSKSVMSSNLRFPDHAKGAIRQGLLSSSLEDISSSRSLRMIIFGSFPLYLALFIPAVLSNSIYLADIVAYQQIHGPVLFTLAGMIGAIVFFVGYMIILNEYPFSIIKAKSDVIEGPYMELASKYRSFVYVTRGFLMFTLGILFSVLFLGIPPELFSWKFIVNIIVALIFPVIMAIASAFSPIFTNRQLYPTVLISSIIGVFAVVIALF